MKQEPLGFKITGRGKDKEIFANERFIIEKELGSGGFGVVYQAYDKEHKTSVALKTFSNIDADGLYRFKREFRLLADMVHPNLVRLYELMSDGEQCFFTMELINGVDFLKYVKKVSNSLSTSPTDITLKLKRVEAFDQNLDFSNQEISSSKKTLPFDENKLRKVLYQIVEGVNALHEVGKIHRDLKPSNIMISNEGRAIILDFGLAAELAPQGTHKSMEITGTPVYMSPEQGLGKPLTIATDWYSIGTMLYEALTGELPFDGSFGNIIMEKATSDPLPPSDLVKGIPEDLDLLCQDLLNRNPKNRPSGREILERLSSVVMDSPAYTSSSAVLLSPQNLFIGREKQLKVLREGFDFCKQGKPVAVFLEGRSGIGKSMIVRNFLEDLALNNSDLVLLSGKCYAQETVPYKAFDNVVDSLSNYLKQQPRLEVEAILPLDILTLAKLFPVLKQVEIIEQAKGNVLSIPGSQELRRKAFAALRELLTRLAYKKQLVICIDDLQWGDADSAALLWSLLCPPDPPPLMLIFCYRSEEAETSPMIKTILSWHKTLAQDIILKEVKVEELSPSEAKELFVSLLGSNDLSGIDHADEIIAESGGNPFFINEFAQYLKFFDTKGDQLNKKLEISLDKVIQKRVENLPEESRYLLEIVAVAGRPLERMLAKEVVNLSNDEQALSLLLATRFVKKRLSNSLEELDTYHDRIRETLSSLLDKQKLKAYHKFLAVALEKAKVVDIESLTYHLYGAGEIEKAAKYAIMAAEQASETLAFDRAAHYYKMALELQTNKTSETLNLQIKLGDAYVNAGRGSEAAQAYLAAAKDSDLTLAIDLERKAGEQLLLSGRIDEGVEVIRKVLSKVQLSLNESPKRTLWSLLLQRTKLWFRGLAFQEKNIDSIAKEELVKIDSCYSASVGLSMINHIYGADYQTRSLLLALKAGEPYRVARAIVFESAFSSMAGNSSSKRTESLILKAKVLARRVNDPYLFGLTKLMAGVAAFMEGRWKKSCELCGEAEKILREKCTGVVWELDIVNIFVMRSLYALGKWREISFRMPTLLKEAKEKNNIYAETNLLARISYITLLASNKADEAENLLKSAIDQWSRQGYQIQHYFALLGKVDTILYSNKPKEGMALFIKEWPALKESLLLRSELLRIEMLHARARLAIACAALETNPTSLLLQAEKDVKNIEKEKTAWGNALASLLHASIASVKGELQKALDFLVIAESRFESSDMALHAAVIRRLQGQIIGGDQGKELIKLADDFMASEDIKNPLAISNTIAPGKWHK
jgi:serine/threonine protein kinase